MATEPEAERLWTVTFRLEPEDLRTSHRTYMKGRYPRQRIYVAILFMMFGAGVGSFVGIASAHLRALPMTIGAGLGLMLFWAIGRSSERDAIRRGEVGGLFTEQTLTLKPEGFEYAFADGRKMFHPWRKVRKLGKAEAYLVFFVDQDQSVVLVPIRAFESEFSADLFLAVAQNWHSKAISPEAQTS